MTTAAAVSRMQAEPPEKHVTPVTPDPSRVYVGSLGVSVNCEPGRQFPIWLEGINVTPGLRRSCFLKASEAREMAAALTAAADAAEAFVIGLPAAVLA